MAYSKEKLKSSDDKVFGLRPSSGLLNLENTALRKLDFFPSSGDWETTALLGPLK
jgi:hypothetical protein